MTFFACALDLVMWQEANAFFLKMLTQVHKVLEFLGTHLELAHLKICFERELFGWFWGSPIYLMPNPQGQRRKRSVPPAEVLTLVYGPPNKSSGTFDQALEHAAESPKFGFGN